MNLPQKFRALFSRKKLDADMAEEMRQHVERRTESNLAAGMSAEEARYAARRQFGGAEQIKEVAREQRGGVWLEQLFRDLGYAARQLIRSRGFTVVALVTLALGIGLNTAMFNIVNSLVFKPLDFPDAGNLFRIVKTTPNGETDGHRPVHFQEIARASGDFARVACSRVWNFTLVPPNGSAEMLASMRVSAGYFSILGLNLQLGRDFRPEEDQPGGNPVVILSHQIWRTHFAADTGIVGKTVRVDGQLHEIVGVAPEAASDVRTVGSPALYRPLALTAKDSVERVDHAFRIIGRYLPGVNAEEVEGRLMAIAAGLAVTDPKEYEAPGQGLRAISLKPDYRASGGQIITMLIALSGFVLLIACANLANLLLARAIARGREFAIRGALGASRAQMIRPLILECGLLALVGGGLGVLVCMWTNAWMTRQFSSSSAQIDFVLDWRLLLFAFATSAATALFFGVAPAWVISRVQVNDVLKSGTRSATGGRTQNRFRQILIVGQFALALVLLSGAAVFVRGIEQLLSREAGWQPPAMLRGILSLPTSTYPDVAAMTRFYEQVQERVGNIPGVTAAAISHELPAFGFPSGRRFIVEGQDLPAAGRAPFMPINGVTPGYFKTVGTRLLRGRDFVPKDRAEAPPVMIINETLAQKLFPDGDVIGRRVAYADEKEIAWIEIVGVAEDVRFLNTGGTGPVVQAYVPLAQAAWRYVTLSVRSAVPVGTLMVPIRQAVSGLDSDMAIKELMPVPALIGKGMQSLQTVKLLLVGFGVLGLFLSALGIYGVIARLVLQRRDEIGIRMALGARMSDVVRLILGSGLRLALGGTAIGLVGAVALSRFLLSTMPGLASGSVGSIALATFALMMVAWMACYLPARRAAKVDPMVALRTE